jgi:lysine/ornithine N-monooxygenase
MMFCNYYSIVSKSIYLNNNIIVRFSGVGGLRIPNIPPEFKTFKGEVVHTAQWNTSLDFNNKRVALVGSGSRYI